MEDEENEQRGREAAMCGAFTSVNMVQPRRVEATRQCTSEDGWPQHEFKFLNFRNSETEFS
jgi:hypothetical protein